jgi:hypothetical protein
MIPSFPFHPIPSNQELADSTTTGCLYIMEAEHTEGEEHLLSTLFMYFLDTIYVFPQHYLFISLEDTPH